MGQQWASERYRSGTHTAGPAHGGGMVASRIRCSCVSRMSMMTLLQVIKQGL